MSDFRLLEDVQEQAPALHVSLSRVGVTNVEKVIRIRANGSEQLYSARLDCFVDLGPQQKGAHMSRFEEVVNDAIGEVVLGEAALRAETLAQHIAERVRDVHVGRRDSLLQARHRGAIEDRLRREPWGFPHRRHDDEDHQLDEVASANLEAIGGEAAVGGGERELLRGNGRGNTVHDRKDIMRTCVNARLTADTAFGKDDRMRIVGAAVFVEAELGEFAGQKVDTGEEAEAFSRYIASLSAGSA